MPLTSLGSAYMEPARDDTHAGQACRALEGGNGHPALLGDLGAIKLRCCHAASASAGQQRTPAGTLTREGGGGQSQRGEGRVVECCRAGEYGVGSVPVGCTALARLTELKGMPCRERGNHLAHQQRSAQPRKSGDLTIDGREVGRCTRLLFLELKRRPLQGEGHAHSPACKPRPANTAQTNSQQAPEAGTTAKMLAWAVAAFSDAAARLTRYGWSSISELRGWPGGGVKRSPQVAMPSAMAASSGRSCRMKFTGKRAQKEWTVQHQMDSLHMLPQQCKTDTCLHAVPTSLLTEWCVRKPVEMTRKSKRPSSPLAEWMRTWGEGRGKGRFPPAANGC